MYTIKTKNSKFNGRREGLLFENGTATTDDKAKAKNLVNVWGYSCEQLQGDSAKEDATTSSDMSADDAITFIREAADEDLEGFVTESEKRVTVLAAWEEKMGKPEE